MKNKCYICRYSTGSYDDYFIANIFVTNDLNKAELWVKKFNSILEKWKKHYRQYEEERHGYSWIKEEYVEDYFDRWIQLSEINKADFIEMEIR